jgi:tetratricopeptide (TPR) repeat protein
MAARLEQAAQPGEILLGEQTRRLARGAIEVEAVEPLVLKGKSGLVDAYRLVDVHDGASALERRHDAPLVGRRDELARLRETFDKTVSARRCRLVTVLGPPGIGKSRLARELALALADDATVLAGRCLPYGDGITYWPLLEIFRKAAGEQELAEALAAAAPEDTFWSVRKALERRARERPLALVVEDIHWAEPTLLDLLEHLVDWTRDAPLFLVCLARPDLQDQRATWGGQENAETLTLEPLSPAESDELIAEVVARFELSLVTRARIGEVAAGNPLFVEQLLAMIMEGGDPDDVPPTIQALLAARLDSLPDEEREVLERAAVVGLEFEWEALGELAPDGRRPAGALLAALVRKELIRPHEAIEDTFNFRHLLIRDAAYDRVPKELRSELHERFAGWLDGRGAEFDEIVGYHLEQAYRCLADLGRPGQRSRALAEGAAERLAGAGRRAYVRADPRAAVSLLERAAELLPDDDPRRLGLLPPLGRALRAEGQLDRADTVLSEAVARGQALGERAVAADAAIALADLRSVESAGTGVGREDVLREIDAAIHVFDEAGDEAGLARALTLRGKYRFWGGETAAALPDLERALRHAREAGDRAEEAESIQYIGAAMRVGPTPVDEALRRLDELDSGGAINTRLEIGFLLARAHFLAAKGDFETARGLASQAGALAKEHGLNDSHARTAAGDIERLAGDGAAAERELRPLCEHYEQVGELGFLASAGPELAEAMHMQGHDEEALLLTDRWRPERLTLAEDADAHTHWRRVRAKVLAHLGELDEAERLGREAVAISSATDVVDLRAQALADLAEVLRLADRREESRAFAEEALELYEKKGNVVAAGRLHALLTEPPIEV